MQLLYDFWQWAGVTPEEYDKNGLYNLTGKEEFDYPHYDLLIDSAKRLINKNIVTNEDIDVFLTVMALDNEAEELLDYIVSNISSIRAKEVVVRGMQHIQSQARWQVAEIAYRLKIEGYLDYLRFLGKDPNDYVRKRAKNCLRYEGCAE